MVADAGGGESNSVSTMTRDSGGGAAKTNSQEESHCFNCRAPNHFTTKQQAQLHKNLKEQVESEEQQEEVH
jgi:hypothetical protein